MADPTDPKPTDPKPTDPKPTDPTPAKPEVKVPDSQKELERLLESARKEEKEKLYGQLEKLKSDLEAARAHKELNEKKLSDAQAKLEAVSKDEDEKAKTVEQKLAELQTTFLAELKKRDEERKTEREQLQQELRNRDLVVKKTEILSKYAGEIIPELVSGNTEEELAQSALIAHQRYKVLEETIRKKTVAGAVPPPPANPGGGVPGGGGSDSALEAQLVGVNDMKTYAAKREELLRTIRGTYRRVR